MSTTLLQRIAASCLAAGVVVAFVLPMAVSGQEIIDPVEDLRQALRLEDVPNPTPFVLEFRRANLDKKIANLKTVGELRRALALDEWKEEKDQGRNEAIRKIDLEMRGTVGKKLQGVIAYVVDKGPPNSRLALANMIAEMGPSIRALDVLDKTGFARSLTPAVAKLAQDKDSAVRQEGLRALGAINPDPDQALPVFRNTLKFGDKDVRALAAQGLKQMMYTTNQLKKKAGATRVEATETDVLRLAEQVVPACQLGLSDVEPRVRGACLEGIRTAALGLVDLAGEPVQRRRFPPEGRKLADDEVKEVVVTYEQVKKELNELEPALKVFASAAPQLIAPLSDPDTSVRLSGVGALEAIAWFRYKEKRRTESVPVPSNLKNKMPPLTMTDPLGPFLDKGLPSVVRLLKDADVTIRRTTLDFMENLGDSAVPLLPALTDALGDSDRFVRWAATRVLGELPPEKARAAVPALARLLSDPDLNVRQAAAASLEAMGKHAASASDVLANALLDGDTELRTMIMGVLIRIPPQHAKVAVPQLIELLANADSRLRKAAAETLGRIGPPAQPAIPALRRLLGDDNAEVRTAASDAILAILVVVNP